MDNAGEMKALEFRNSVLFYVIVLGILVNDNRQFGNSVSAVI